MNQTAKRILATVLTLLMLISSMSVYTFAGSYEPDEEYYNKIISDSVVVNTEWANCKDGDKVTYTYRDKTITETFDSTIHFSSITTAYEYCTKKAPIKVKNPVIILCPGVYNENLEIGEDVTILGPNAGIDPNVKGSDKSEAWTVNPNRTFEALLRGHIVVDRFLNEDIETVLDGVTLFTNFAYVERGEKNSISSVVVKNTIIKGAGSTTDNNKTINTVFYFDESIGSKNNVTLKDVRVTDMNTSSLFGANVTNIDVDGLFYTKCTAPAFDSTDSYTNQTPIYKIKNSMFYDNDVSDGVVVIGYSDNRSTSNSNSTVEITDCVFKDGDSNTTTAEALAISPIVCTVVSSKNKINVNNCLFESKGNRTVSPLGLVLTSEAKLGTISDSIKFNSNELIGYSCLVDTSGLSKNSAIDFTGNYFADYNGVQANPVYPSNASIDNVIVDYYWLNRKMTLPSSIYHVESTGIANSEIDNVRKTIKLNIEYGEDAKLNLIPVDNSTTYTLYTDNEFANKIDEIDMDSLYTGEYKNVYYVKAVSTKYPGYFTKYTLYLSTYNPDYAIDFNLKNTYMLDPKVSDMKKGSSYYKSWDDMAYRFTVGENVFATTKEIYAICKDTVPTIILPAGTVESNIELYGSAIVRGAKYGINPNIPQNGNPQEFWEMNPDRAQSDQETIYQNGVIYISAEAVNATVEIDGITFGTNSGFGDTGEKLETKTVITLKNIIIDGAGGASYTEILSTGEEKIRNLNAIFMIGAAKNYSTNHKNLTIENLRMDSQGKYALLTAYCENMLFDGICYINNAMPMTNNGLTAPEGQDFRVELRNSYFGSNTTDDLVFLVDNKTTKTAERSKNEAIFHHNTFYNASKWVYSATAVIFSSSKDSIYFCNNDVIATLPIYNGNYYSFISGNQDYFTEELDKRNFDDPNYAEMVTDVTIKYNRFVGACTYCPSQYYCNPNSKWNFDYNYTAETFDKSASGIQVMQINSGSENSCENNYYFADWDMTTLTKSKDVVDEPLDNAATEISYKFYGTGKVNTENKTYTDTVDIDTASYDFGIELDNKLVSYKIYSDKDHLEEVKEPVSLSGGENNFYIVFSSYSKNTETYEATITKPIGTEADILRFSNWKLDGTSIYTCVPLGTTTFKLPDIITSSGASYSIYNDRACTLAFNSNTITGISTVPSFKYIKVISEDGNTEKVYTLSLIQSENDQAEITYIEGATKISDTKFEVKIPGNKASFELIADYSNNATLYIENEEKVVELGRFESLKLNNIDTPQIVNLKVVSNSGNSKKFQLVIKKDTSNTDISSINMVEIEENRAYEVLTRNNSFTVNPEFKNSDTYFSLYKDADCTDAYESDTIHLKQRTTIVYMEVTSSDATKTNVVELEITCLNYKVEVNPGDEVSYLTIDNAEMLSPTHFIAHLEPDATSYTVNFTPVDSRYNVNYYEIYADPSLKAKIINYTNYNYDTGEGMNVAKIDLTTSTSTVYIKLGVKKIGIEQIIRLDIISERTPVTYTDASVIPSWAIKQVNYLNEGGYGYFIGSDGKFNPSKNISRFEVAIIAARFVGVNAEYFITQDIPFTDEIPTWATNSVKACYTLGIMSGVNEKTFKGQSSTTREQFAKIISNMYLLVEGYTDGADAFYNKYKDTIDSEYESSYNFVDESSISEWAKPYIKLATVEFGVINGSKDGDKLYMNPKKNITRQEVAVVLANCRGYRSE